MDGSEFVAAEWSQSEGAPAAIDAARNTQRVFALTLAALTDGGQAPLSLDPGSAQQASCPPARGEIRGQLETVAGRWAGFSGQVDRILSGNEGQERALQWIQQNNLDLLAEEFRDIGRLIQQEQPPMLGKVASTESP